MRVILTRTRLIQPLGAKWSYVRSALLGKQGVCIYKRSKRTSSVAAGNPFLLAGVAPFVKGDVETPGDLSGVLYVPMDSSGAWKMDLAKNMKAVGLPVDMNKFL